MKADGRKSLYAAVITDPSLRQIRDTDPLRKQIDCYCDVLKGFLAARGYTFLGWTPIKQSDSGPRLASESELGERLASLAILHLRKARLGTNEAATHALVGGICYARAYALLHDARISSSGPASRKRKTARAHDDIAEHARQACAAWKKSLRPSIKELFNAIPSNVMGSRGLKAFAAILCAHNYKDWTYGPTKKAMKGHR